MPLSSALITSASEPEAISSPSVFAVVVGAVRDSHLHRVGEFAHAFAGVAAGRVGVHLGLGLPIFVVLSHRATHPHVRGVVDDREAELALAGVAGLEVGDLDAEGSPSPPPTTLPSMKVPSGVEYCA